MPFFTAIFFMSKTLSNLFYIIFALLLMALAGCDSSQQQAPQSDVALTVDQQADAGPEARAVLDRFIQASIARNYPAYYGLLSQQDQAARSLQAFIQEKTQGGVTLADAFYDRIQYRIETMVVEADSATAMVDYRFPNVEFMIKDTFGLSILSDFTDAEIRDLKMRLESAYQDKSLPMKTSRRNFRLLREADGWRVLLGWKKSADGMDKKPAIQPAS